MEEAIDERTRDDLIAEDAPPLPEGRVGRQDEGPPLVAAAHRLEEVVRLRPIEAQVPHLVHLLSFA